MSRNGTAFAGRGARRGLTWGTVAIGIGGAMVGVVVGFIVGFIVGGNIGSAWIPWVKGGPDQDYLAAAPVGAVVGGVAFGVLAFWLASRRRVVK
ncbi:MULTISPECIES: hypothetical protein [unclassified Streptomyces]|uniref:hypothetical protein n=1 Tax=unclassified Streptomyces TaxID=2593676 RepID=UPI003D9026D7